MGLRFGGGSAEEGGTMKHLITNCPPCLLYLVPLVSIVGGGLLWVWTAIAPMLAR